MKRVQQSNRDHTKALAIARQLGDRFIEGQALAGLGNTLLIARRPKEAITILRRAADITQQNGDTKLASLALIALGSALLKIGRGDEAFSLFEKVADLDPDLDPLDILYVGTQGKVRSFSRFMLERAIAAESAGRTDRDHSQKVPRNPAKRSRPKRRR